MRIFNFLVWKFSKNKIFSDFYQDPLVRVRPNIPCGLIADILRAVFTGRMDWRGVAQFWANELTVDLDFLISYLIFELFIVKASRIYWVFVLKIDFSS